MKLTATVLFRQLKLLPTAMTVYNLRVIALLLFYYFMLPMLRSYPVTPMVGL